MLSVEQKKQAETLVVETILGYRRGYIGARKGRVTPDYWDRIQEMVEVATSEQTIPEWGQCLQKDLQISGLDKSACQALIELANWTEEHATDYDALTYIEKNSAFLIGLARMAVDARKAAGEQEVAFTPEALVDAAKQNGLWEE